MWGGWVHILAEYLLLDYTIYCCTYTSQEKFDYHDCLGNLCSISCNIIVVLYKEVVIYGLE